MKKLYYLFLLPIISLNFLYAQSPIDSKNSIERLGSFKNKITLDKHQDYYLFTFKDISPANKGEKETFRMRSKEKLNDFERTISEGFKTATDSSINFETEDFEFRLYYKNPTVKSDYVEIILENKETEETYTLPWLTQKSVKELFGNED